MFLVLFFNTNFNICLRRVYRLKLEFPALGVGYNERIFHSFDTFLIYTLMITVICLING